MADKKFKDIKVAIRVRKLIKREDDAGLRSLWSVDNEGKTIYTEGSQKHSFSFDRVFTPKCSTKDVFDDLVKPVVENVMQGINGTIFAYGQTSSGKTHTMMGQGHDGLIAYCISDIYNYIESTPQREFIIRVAVVEIYNETLTDLLSKSKQTLDIRELQNGQFELRQTGKAKEKCVESVVVSVDEALAQFKIASECRHTGATAMNESSSRSHTIFRIIIESREREVEGGIILLSQLNLVDLAGSENAKQTGATGQRLVEGSHINKSLLTLCNVVNQLSVGAGFISYRDCKLTRLLQHSLGGNSLTTFVCCVTPAVQEETLSTLRFAQSAKKVKNQPVINEASMENDGLFQQHRQLIMHLQQQLQECRAGEIADLQKKFEDERQLRADLESKFLSLQKIVSVSSQIPLSDDRTKVRNKRRETWAPGSNLVQLQQTSMSFATGFLAEDIPDLNENTALSRRSEPLTPHDTDVNKKRTNRGPAARSASNVQSSLESLEECSEAETPERDIEADYARLEVERRSFQKFIVNKAMQSRESAEFLLGIEIALQTAEIGVQTEELCDLTAARSNESVHVEELAVAPVIDADVTEQLQTLRVALVEAQSEIDNAHEQTQSVQSKLDSAIQQLATVEQEAMAAKSELSAIREEIDIHKGENARLRQEAEDLRQQLVSNKSVVVCENDGNSQDTEVVIPIQQDLVLQLQMQLKETELELEKVRLHSAMLSAEVDSLKTEMEAANAAKENDDTIKSESVQLKIDSENLTEQLKRSRGEASELSTKLVGIEGELELLKVQLSRANADADEMRNENEQLKIRAELLKSEMEHSKFEVQSLSRFVLERSQMDSELDQTLSAEDVPVEVLMNAKIAEERAIFEKEKQELSRIITDSHELSMYLSEQVTLLKKELAEVKRDRDVKDADAKSYQLELKELREFTTWEKEFRDASILGHQEECKSELKEKIVELQNQCDDLRQQLEDMSNEKQAREKDTRSSLAGVAAEEEMNCEESTEARTATSDELTNNCDSGAIPNKDLVERDNTIAELQLRIKEQTALAIDAQDEIMDLQDKNFSLQSAVEELNVVISTLRNQLSDAQNEIVAAKSEASEMQIKNNDQVEIIRSLNEQKAESEMKLVELEKKVSELTKDLACSRTESVSKQPQIKNSSDTECWQSSLSTIGRFGVDDNEGLKKENDELLKRTEKLTTELKEAHERLLVGCNREQSSQKHFTDLEMQLKDVTEKNFQLSAKLLDVETRMVNEIQEHTRRVKKAECDLQLAEHRRIEAEREAMSLKNEIAALESATFQTEVFLSNSRRHNEDDYHKMEEHVKKMSLQLDLTKQRCANYEAKIKTLEAEAKKSVTEAMQLSDEFDCFKRNCQQQHSHLSSELSKLSAVRDELKKLEKINSLVEAEFAKYRREADEKVSSLKDQLADVTADKNQLQANVNGMMELEAEYRVYRQNKDLQCSELTLANGELQRQMLDWEKKYAELMESTTGSIASKDESISQLVSRIAEVEEECRSLRDDDIKKLTERLTDLTSLISAKDELICQLEETKAQYEMKKLESEHTNMADRDELVDQLSKLEVCYEEYRRESECRHLRDLEELQSLKAAYEAEKIALENQLASVQDELEILKQKLQTHDADVDEIKMQCRKEVEQIKTAAQETICVADAELSRLSKDHQHQIEQLNADWESKISELKCTHESEMKNTEQMEYGCGPIGNEQLLAAVEDRHAEELSCLREQQTNDIQLLKSEQEIEIKNLVQIHEAELKQKFDEYSDEISRLKSSYEAQLNEINERHQKEMALHASDLAAEFGRRAEEQYLEVAKMAQDMASLQEQLDRQTALCSQTAAELAAAIEQHKSDTAERDSLHANELAARDELAADAEMVVMAKESEIANLETALEESRNSLLRERENMFRQHNEEVTSLKVALQQINDENSSLLLQHKNEIAIYQEKLAALTAKFDEGSLENADNIHQQLIDKEVEIGELRSKIEQLEATIQYGHNLLTQLKDEKTQLTENYEADLDDLETERNQLITAKDLLESELQSAQEKAANCERHTASIEQKWLEEEVKYKTQLEVADQKEASLVEKVELLATQTSELASIKNRLERDLADKNAALNDLQVSLNGLLSERNELISKVEQLKVSIEELKNENERLSTKTNDNNCLTNRILELEEQLKKTSESPEEVESLKKEIETLKKEVEELDFELTMADKRHRGYEYNMKQKEVELIKKDRDLYAVRKELQQLVERSGSSVTGVSFEDGLKGYKEQVERLQKECQRLEKVINEVDAERDAAVEKLEACSSDLQQLERIKADNETLLKEKHKLEAEISSLTAEMDKIKHEPTDVAILRRQVADSRLEVNHLKTQMIRITEPLERKIKSLEKELENSKGARRDLENKLRRQQNDADLTFAAAPVTRPAADKSGSIGPVGSTNLSTSCVMNKQQSLDLSSVGTVGHMLIAKAEAEIGALKRQVNDQTKKICELKQANERMKSENADLHARLARKVDRESQLLSPRSVLSPRQDQRLLAMSTPSLSSSSRLNMETEPGSSSAKSGNDPSQCRPM